MLTTYKTYLRAVGRKPIPPYDKLRTSRKPGDREMTATGVKAVRS